MDLQGVDNICSKHGNKPNQLIGILHDIQGQYRYLPEKLLCRVSELLKVPLSQIYSVATFFKAFSLTQRGKHEIHVCMGTACHVRGSSQVLDNLEQELGVKAGETTADGFATLETVNCVGACALGPVVVVDGKYHGHICPSKVGSLVPHDKSGDKKKCKCKKH